MELLPGTYKVREIEVIDWQQTWPTEGEYTVTLASSQKVEDLDFGNREMSDNRIFLPLLIKND